MIERLQREVSQLEHLSPEEQEEVAIYIEALRAARESTVAQPERATAEPWHDSAGAWSDLPEDDEAATFYRMRHETAPSAPIEL